MSQPTGEISGGRPLLKGKVLGIPVHLDLSFLVVMAILGYVSGFGLREFLLWLVITPLAVLVHELGHGVTARAAGAHPEIALAGLGGVTQFTPPGPLSRARSFGISVAGPLVGLAVGGVVLVVWFTVVGDVPPAWNIIPASLGGAICWIATFTCIGWSLLNLLPVLPLDGGQAMRELLPGDEATRARSAAAISIPVAVVVGLAAYLVLGQLFMALFMAFFAVENAMFLRRPSGPAPVLTTTGKVVQALWSGDPATARRHLEDNPTGQPIDLAAHGAVIALTGDREQGHALLEQEIARRPDEPDPVALLALTLVLEHDWDRLFALLRGPYADKILASIPPRAMAEARDEGRGDVAMRLAEMVRTGR